MARHRAPQPDPRYVQLMALDWAPVETDKPRARRSQPTVAEWDHALVALARVKHPRCAWWWATRTTDGAFGAYCYVCDSVIATAYVKFGLSKESRDLIAEHRAGHYLDSLSHLTNQGT